ncbi:MAG: tellurium resistance protein TerC, partial [Gammaproteobacteria bacterium]|nr:tellurium resistance protein TerC [Gammaproteobacteria bacterium]
TFYFVIVVMALSDVVQSRYRRKLIAENAAQLRRTRKG